MSNLDNDLTKSSLIFNVANLNQGNHYDTSTGKFTCPVTGIYQVTAYALDSNSTDPGACYLQVNVNGTMKNKFPQNSILALVLKWKCSLKKSTLT